MKGQEWYQEELIAESYEDKRFTGGGQLIDDREREIVLNALEPLDGKRILEVACGTGRFTVMLARHGANITGLDISTAMLSQGREKARTMGVYSNLDFVIGDAGRLPFPDDYFDAVFAIRFFHLTHTPTRFLAEMQRVAREQVFFDTFNARSARTVYNRLLPMGSHLYSLSDVAQLLRSTGLNLRSSTHDFIIPYGLYRSLPSVLALPLRFIDRTILEIPLGNRLATVSYWDCAP